MSEDAKAEAKREFLRARADDIKVREQIRQKDAVSIEQVKKDLIQEEQELKTFFDPAAANASANPKLSGQEKNQGEDDPTVISNAKIPTSQSMHLCSLIIAFVVKISICNSPP